MEAAAEADAPGCSLASAGLPLGCTTNRGQLVKPFLTAPTHQQHQQYLGDHNNHEAILRHLVFSEGRVIFQHLMQSQISVLTSCLQSVKADKHRLLTYFALKDQYLICRGVRISLCFPDLLFDGQDLRIHKPNFRTICEPMMRGPTSL